MFNKKEVIIGEENIFNRLFFFDVFSIISIIKSRNDPNLDNIKLSNKDSASYLCNKLNKEILKSKNNDLNLRFILYSAFKYPYLLLAIWKLFWIAFLYTSSFLLINLLLKHLESPSNEEVSKEHATLNPHITALCLFLSTVLSSICINQLKVQSTRIGMRVRASLMVIIYRKSLKLNTAYGEIGETIGLIGNDCNTIAESFVNFHYLWSTSLELLVVILISIFYLGALITLPLIGILLLFALIQFILSQKVASLYKNRSKMISERIYLISEVLTAIKLIKFYAWESYFMRRLSKLRRKEIREYRKILLSRCIIMSIVFITPMLATAVTLKMYQMITTYPLTAEIIFTLLSLFNILRYPLLMLPISIESTRAAFASIKNVQKFLKKSEIPLLEKMTPNDPNSLTKMIITNCSFSWSLDSKPCLEELTMRFSSEKLYAIVGDVGSGKSSLLCALMGQMYKKSGDIYNYGSVSYVPNEPWILKASLRDNILFGSKYYSEKYKRIIRICGLAHDLKTFSNGDRTEIGERGLNLTLGQRHRISIARAIYRDSDIVLLDDPLSCMDQRIGKHIFKECVQEYLNEKAVIFVTNQLQYLPSCDYIFVMKNGKCIEQGSFTELSSKDFDLASLVGQSLEIEDPHKIDDLSIDIESLKIELESNDTSRIDYKPNITFTADLPKLSTIKEAEASKLDVDSADFSENIQSAPSVTFSRTNTIEKPSNSVEINEVTISSMMKRASILSDTQEMSKIIDKHQLSVLGNSLPIPGNSTSNPNPLGSAFEKNQLTIHSFYALDNAFEPATKEDKKEIQKLTRRSYLGFLNERINIYITLAFAFVFVVIHSIRLYSDYWLKEMIDGDTSSFNVNGYFILVGAFYVSVFCRGIMFLWAMTTKSISFHISMLKYTLFAPMSFFEFTSLAKILHSFSGHLSIIDDRLLESAFQILQFLPIVLGCLILSIIVLPILAVPSIILLTLAIVLIWYTKGIELKLTQYESMTMPPIFSHLSSTLEGLHTIRIFNVKNRFDSYNLIKVDVNNKVLIVLTYIRCWLSLCVDVLASFLIYATCLIIIFSNVDTARAGLVLTNIMQLLLYGQITAQAIHDFHNSIISVDQLTCYRKSVNPENPLIGNEAPENWPEHGKIEFKDVTLRYHRYEVAVLKHVSFIIEPHEKIAIVGCTGSGKTTLLTSILRMVEIAEGSILIDDVNISNISLFELRKNIAVIPNEPVLFFGTIRSNLDPYNVNEDSDMWGVLKTVYLYDIVKEMPLGLDTVIKENGAIFSYGQRQLFCIARTILLKCRIIILDEATSALDINTDKMIQEIISKTFKNNTVLFVTHRLNTIIDSDRVLVMDNGKLSEFDRPDLLLNDEESKLYSLISSYKTEEINNLQKMSIIKHEQRLKRRNVSRGNTIKELCSNTIRSKYSNKSSMYKTGMPMSLDNVFSGYNNE